MNFISRQDEAALVLAYMDFLVNKESHGAIRATQMYMEEYGYSSVDSAMIPLKLAQMLHDLYVNKLGYERSHMLEIMEG